MSLSRFSKIAAITTQNKLWDFRAGRLLRGEDACQQLLAKLKHSKCYRRILLGVCIQTVWILFLLVCSSPKNIRKTCTNLDSFC